MAMMNQYRNSPRTGGCGRGRDDTATWLRASNGGPSGNRCAAVGGRSSSPHSSCGCHTRAVEESCPVTHRQNRGDGEGCGNGRGDCNRLMEQIRAVDFALYETVLYLDAYPHSCDALETYHKLKAQSEVLHKEYETTCGPLTAFGNNSTTSWDWMSQPFPWEYDAD